MKGREGEAKSREERKRNAAAVGDHEIEVPLVVSWTAEEIPGHLSKVAYSTRVRLTWEDTLAELPLKAGEAKNRITLLKMFGDALAGRLKGMIEAQGRSKIGRLHGKVEAATFDKIIAGLTERGWIEVTTSPQYVKQRSTYWRLSLEGTRRKT